jgi:16S rRNA (cytosine967-C5)-methyltransferase
MIAPARRAAFDALLAHSARGTDLPAALATAHRTLADARDHTLLTELVTGTLRMRAALDFQLAQRTTRPLESLDAAVLASLRLGAFQILFLDRVPASAVVNDAVSLMRRGGKTSAGGFVNAVLRTLARDRKTIRWPEGTDAAALAVRHSHPQWLVERWLQRYGAERTERWLVFNNTPPRLCLATNRTMGDRDTLAEALAAEGVTTTPTTRAADGLIVVDGPILASAALREGRCVIQDEASQLIAGLGAVVPGQRVLDLCAAPGGKSMTLASRVAPDGQVVACDVRPRRVRLLRELVARTRLPHTAIVQVPQVGPLPFTDGAFDFILIDAPCSGLGTLRRDPDIRWGRQAADLPRLVAQQRELLARAAGLVRPGGALVYATCSSEPEENDEVVAAFLAEQPDFTLQRLHRTTPPDDELEAFFGAVIARNL